MVICMECASAHVASREVPYYICTDCGNAGNGGEFLNVVFPPNKEAIENVLMKRFARRSDRAPTRNWWPNETLADLIRENAEHPEAVKR
jgi:hypothetical protein